MTSKFARHAYDFHVYTEGGEIFFEQIICSVNDVQRIVVTAAQVPFIKAWLDEACTSLEGNAEETVVNGSAHAPRPTKKSKTVD
jgi:hypothetical protein